MEISLKVESLVVLSAIFLQPCHLAELPIYWTKVASPRASLRPFHELWNEYHPIPLANVLKEIQSVVETTFFGLVLTSRLWLDD
jgi:hypothetical protein